MSFYTSLTGLNAATAQLGVTSNNIANVSTTGFKRSRTDFGDIFATSPLQKASATIGQGVSLKRVVQEFGQGNMMFSSNTLDLAISGDGFFPLKSQDGFQDIFTRNGVFMMNDQYNVVNSAGQKLMAASVDSSGKANLDDMNVLTIPQKTTGMAKQTSKVSLGLNFPADAGVITKDFNRNDPDTYNKSTALTVYDAGGNSYLATVYYAKTQNASQASPNNKWQTFVYVGDKLVNASLQQATNSTGELMYVNKYGELKAKSDFKTPEEIAELNSSFSKKTVKFSLDDLTDVRTSQPATIVAGLATDLGTGSNDGIDFGNYVNISKSDLLHQQGSSAVTYELKESVVGARVITFGPAAARSTVTVAPTNGTTPATPAEVATALNANANFASTYVAQAASPSVVVSGISFGGSPTINPFSSFGINIGGKQFDLKNLDTSILTPAALAASLQSRLRVADGGRSDISVAYSGTSLTISDAAQRNITDFALTKTSAASVASNTASVGADPVYADPILKITALDPNVTADDINSTTTGVSVMQGSELIAGTKQETPFTRAVADYTLSASSDAFKVNFGTVTSPVTVEGTSGADLVDKLNKDATFSSDFIASYSSTDKKLTIQARDPSNASAQSISNSLKIYQNSGPASTVFGLIGTKTSAQYALDPTPATDEVSTVTFENLAPGKSVTVAGLTYTNSNPSGGATILAADVASKYAAYDKTVASSLVGFTNALTGFTKATSATGTDLVFTADTSGHVTDITVTSTGTVPTVATTPGTATETSVTIGTQTITAQSLPDLQVALQNDAAFSSAFTANINTLTGQLTITAKDPFSEAGQVLPIIKQKLEGTTTVFTTKAGTVLATGNPVLTSGVASDIDVAKKSIDDLKNLFSVNVDNAIEPVTVGLDHLLDSMSKLPASQSKKLSGTQIAAELTNVISRAYGDEKPFNFSAMGSPTFKVQMTLADKTARTEIPINLAAAKDMHSEDLVREVQTQIDSYPQYNGMITVSYDTQAQKLVFASKDNAKVTLSSEQSGIGLADPLVQGVNDQSVGLTLAPSVSASAYRASNDQRYGMKVEYDTVKQSFVFKSGTTGDDSGISITSIRPGSLATQTSKGLGMTGDPASYLVTPSTVDALRGIVSQPAVLSGNALAVNVDNNFSVDATNNQFVVSVNGITGTVVVPPKDTYTLGTFMEALQSGINNLQGPSKNGLTPESVNGVTVGYNAKTNALEFKTGTASTDSYIKVTGDARWGLDGLDAKFGTTTTWIKPKSFTDEKGATVYIDGFGSETSSAAGFETLPSWSPIYFDKGELTFDTAGNLVSPKQGAQLDTVYLPNGKGALTINIDYSKSTQFASPFSVLSQSQDGAPEGDLVGLAIADDGLVSASFSNGAQKSLGKVVLVNFSNPSGLRQIGDTNYYKTSDSGTPKYGEAGSAGFGTVRSGATERANVDLTQELVDLITEQRNFQANAKAMETSTSMTQTIIQIRN